MLKFNAACVPALRRMWVRSFISRPVKRWRFRPLASMLDPEQTESFRQAVREVRKNP